MLKVAITGNIAAGKTKIEEVLSEKGYKVLDTDTVTHELLTNKNVIKKIKETFFNLDIFEEEQISRTKLGKIVFENVNLRKQLEEILHPLIKEKMDIFFEENKNKDLVFVSVPLLFESNFDKYFDKIILIYANDGNRLERLIKRNNLSLEDALNRINSQTSQDKKISLADYVIYNDKSFSEVTKDIEKTLKLL